MKNDSDMVYLIFPEGEDTEVRAARHELESRGWRPTEDLAKATVVFVGRGWRDDPAAAAKLGAARQAGKRIYYSPNQPPKLNCPDFAHLSGVNWQNATRPLDEKKGRSRWQCGMPLSDGFPLVELARECGHKVTAQISPYNETTLVVSVHADRRRTFYLKLWCSNRTQAQNAFEEIASLELFQEGGAA